MFLSWVPFFGLLVKITCQGERENLVNILTIQITLRHARDLKYYFHMTNNVALKVWLGLEHKNTAIYYFLTDLGTSHQLILSDDQKPLWSIRKLQRQYRNMLNWSFLAILIFLTSDVLEPSNLEWKYGELRQARVILCDFSCHGNKISKIYQTQSILVYNQNGLHFWII